MAHTHYKGTGKIHSFRGLLEDGGQDKIGIQGSVGAVAWRIAKFNIISNNPNSNIEHLMQIWREEQDSISTTIDISKDDWLASAWESGGGYSRPENSNVVIADMLFVRNIWVTHTEIVGSTAGNYYIELEEVKVSKASMAQLAVAAARHDTSLA